MLGKLYHREMEKCQEDMQNRRAQKRNEREEADIGCFVRRKRKAQVWLPPQL